MEVMSQGEGKQKSCKQIMGNMSVSSIDLSYFTNIVGLA